MCVCAWVCVEGAVCVFVCEKRRIVCARAQVVVGVVCGMHSGAVVSVSVVCVCMQRGCSVWVHAGCCMCGEGSSVCVCYYRRVCTVIVLSCVFCAAVWSHA